MAAIVCKGCYNCCSASCEGCSKCTAASCEGCHNCCEGGCRLCCAPEKPFPLCSSFTLCVNFIPACIMITFSILDWNHDCGTPLAIWLLISSIVFFTNFGVAVYMYWRFSLDTEVKQTAIDRGWKILCYDPVMCIYFLILIFEAVWAVMGIVWLAGSECSDEYDGVFYMSLMAIILLFIYLTLGGIIACCSVCCQCCREGVDKIGDRT